MVLVAVGDAQPSGAVPPPAAAAPAPPAGDGAQEGVDDLPIAVAWDAPGECPGVEALKAEFRRVAGHVPPPAERLSAQVTVRRGPGRAWLLTLATKTGTRVGERRLAGSDCAELMRAAALILGLMINPKAGFVETAPPPAPPPLPPPPTAVPDDRFAAGADLQFGRGAQPAVAPGVGVRFAIAAAAFSAELRASFWTSRSTASSSDAAAGGTFRFFDVGAAGCGRAWRRRGISPALCVGAALAHLQASGYGVSNPGEASAWWPAAFAEASLRERITRRNAVRLAAQAVIPAGNPTFDLAGVGHVFQPASIWLRVGVGWELHF